MNHFLFVIIGAALAVSCTSATLHQSSGRLGGQYSLHMSRITGPVDSSTIRSAIAEEFFENGVIIEENARRQITCSCDLSFIRKDYVLLAVSDYSASVRCSTATGSFEAVGSRQSVERLMTGASVALALNDVVPVYAIVGGVLLDIILSGNTESAYKNAARVAVREGVRETATHSSGRSR